MKTMQNPGPYRSVFDIFEMRDFDYRYLKQIHSETQWNG